MSWNFDQRDMEELERDGWVPLLFVIVVLVIVGLISSALKDEPQLRDEPEQRANPIPDKVGCKDTECGAMMRELELEGQCYCLYMQ
jgi:hypothetical protein